MSLQESLAASSQVFNPRGRPRRSTRGDSSFARTRARTSTYLFLRRTTPHPSADIYVFPLSRSTAYYVLLWSTLSRDPFSGRVCGPVTFLSDTGALLKHFPPHFEDGEAQPHMRTASLSLPSPPSPSSHHPPPAVPCAVRSPVRSRAGRTAVRPRRRPRRARARPR